MAAEVRIVAADGTVVADVLMYDYRYYRINNTEIEMIDEIEAFCFGCSQFVASERMRTPDELSREIAWVEALATDQRANWESICGSFESLLEKRQIAVDRWRVRRSPPRCLECGSTNLLQATRPIGDESPRLMHPDYMPQGLNVEFFAFASTASGYKLFNLEGEELRMSTKEILESVNHSRVR